MFNLIKKILKRDNEYVSCNWLEHGINFDSDFIKICCMCFHEGQGPLPVMKYNGGIFDYDKFFKQKEKIRKLNKKGIIHNNCKGCINLTKGKWDNDNYISYINIDNQTACNSNCTYCYTSSHKEFYNSKKAYEIMPVIEELINKKLLKPGGEVMFGGGEPTINEEFEKLVNLFLDKGFNYIKVHSSGIKYSEAIERCLKEDKGDIIISPDSGTKELYKIIKQVDCFDEVWANLKKYSDAQSQNKNQVKTKYVIVPGINDKTNDIDDFFSKVVESSINSVRIDIELDWYNKNRSNSEELTKLFKLLNYSKEKAESLKLDQFFFQVQAQTAINENASLYNNVCSTN